MAAISAEILRDAVAAFIAARDPEICAVCRDIDEYDGIATVRHAANVAAAEIMGGVPGPDCIWDLTWETLSPIVMLSEGKGAIEFRVFEKDPLGRGAPPPMFAHDVYEYVAVSCYAGAAPRPRSIADMCEAYVRKYAPAFWAADAKAAPPSAAAVDAKKRAYTWCVLPLSAVFDARGVGAEFSGYSQNESLNLALNVLMRGHNFIVRVLDGGAAAADEILCRGIHIFYDFRY